MRLTKSGSSSTVEAPRGPHIQTITGRLGPGWVKAMRREGRSGKTPNAPSPGVATTSLWPAGCPGRVLVPHYTNVGDAPLTRRSSHGNHWKGRRDQFGIQDGLGCCYRVVGKIGIKVDHRVRKIRAESFTKFIRAALIGLAQQDVLVLRRAKQHGPVFCEEVILAVVHVDGLNLPHRSFRGCENLKVARLEHEDSSRHKNMMPREVPSP